MIATLRRMLTCRWAARRIQRYLDADPAAPLDPAEVARLESHLAECVRCGRLTEQYQQLHQALDTLAERGRPDQAMLNRLHHTADRLVGGDRE
ncbi:MAG: zf-HC2 domain-containing protein [Nocardioidaceae bacterium]